MTRPADASGRRPASPESPFRVQTKLAVNTPGDVYEQEADSVAAKVTSMSEAQVQRACACEGGECNRCQAGKVSHEHVQTKRASAGVSGEKAPPAVQEVLGSSGQPLDSPTRAFMEPRFGQDFSHVRVHTDARAAESARELNANAYTVGHNIAFGSGQYAPETHKGRQLLAHELTHTIQQNGTAGNPGANGRQMQLVEGGSGLLQRECKPSGSSTLTGNNKVAFAIDEGLNLRERPDQTSKSLAQLKFGLRVHIVEEPKPTPSWRKVTALGKVGYVYEPRILYPKEELIKKDPGLRLVMVKPGQTFWGLVKSVYGIQGNESTKDQNINHFINAIRAVNEPCAFKVETDTLDKVGNYLIPGRDATDTQLKAGYKLWIPSFGVASKMDVGSGTVRGEITRLVKNLAQKLKDFKDAAKLSVGYMPGAIKAHVGEMAEGLIEGLIEFAADAARILAISTAIGAIIGAFFGGVGALPGAEIGFEIGLIILEYYGLYMIIEAILGVAFGLLSALGEFIVLVWTADSDKDKLTKAAMKLADGIGILVSAVLVVLVAYLLKKGADFIKQTPFAEKVGKPRLAKWLEDRQKKTTSKAVAEQKTAPAKLDPHQPPVSDAKPLAPEKTDAKPVVDAATTKGAALAKKMGYPAAEPGYHWAAVDDKLIYRRNPLRGAGPKLPERVYDPKTKTFKNAEIKTPQAEPLEGEAKSNAQKGKFGELRADAYMEKEGFDKRGSHDVPGPGGGKPKPQGIDGVYEKRVPPPKWVVGEAKYGSSGYGETASGKQLSTPWTNARLDHAVGKTQADLIRLEGYERWELRVDAAGEVTKTKITWER